MVMDALYFYTASVHGGEELRYSLRSLEKHAPYIRKVWIFGDRPAFISNNKSVIQHVFHDAVNILGLKTPVTNFFLLHVLSSLIPELSHDYLRLSDDFILLEDLSEEEARKDRYVENMNDIPAEALPHRTRGKWQDQLWLTHDILKREGMQEVINFEIHAPCYMTKTRVLMAYNQLKKYVTEDKWFGLMGRTAILNYAHAKGMCDLVKCKVLGTYGGDVPEMADHVIGQQFLNFDDAAWQGTVKHFLETRFPEPSKYEKQEDTCQ